MIYKPHTNRRGVVVILACVTLIAIFAVLALSLDGGSLLAERRRAQGTADAAAVAGACDIFDNYYTNHGDDVGGTAKASALVTAKANGYANDGASPPRSPSTFPPPPATTRAYAATSKSSPSTTTGGASAPSLALSPSS